jgi:dTDP-4-amino-4,6-dideoxygalactose transaminase
VLCSSFTFSGSCNPIAYVGADPIFVDSERETWNVDPDLLEQAIETEIRNGRKPSAMIVVHLYGMPAKIDRIMDLSRHYKIPVIEDAAEALGSVFKNQKLGTFGDVGVYSFNGNKIITTSGGGAMVSANSEIITKAKFLSTQARDPAPHYQHSQIGFNYRLSNVCAAIGVGQMQVLEHRIERKRQIFHQYQRAFPGLIYQDERTGSVSNRWLTTVLFENPTITPEKIRLALEAENIESRPLWKPMHLQPVFAKAKSYLNGVSQELFEKGLCLPSSTSMGSDDFDRIVGIISRHLAG